MLASVFKAMTKRTVKMRWPEVRWPGVAARGSAAGSGPHGGRGESQNQCCGRPAACHGLSHLTPSAPGELDVSTCCTRENQGTA